MARDVEFHNLSALGRGKRLVVVIGQTKALALAVKRLGAVKRLTNLQARLRQAVHGEKRGISQPLSSRPLDA